MASDRILIRNDEGELVEAAAPVVISASRSTDIPAFYAEWFFRRLEKGHCARLNPFSRQKAYISFRRCKAVVFWTKNPKPMLPLLRSLDERGIHYYFQFTLNDYEKEGLEPNVPPLGERVETFRELSGMIGREKVIWRFDPLLVASQIAPRDLLSRIRDIGGRLKGRTDKLVFSFADVNAYRNVRSSLAKYTRLFTRESAGNAEPGPAQRAEIAEGLKGIRGAWEREGWDVRMAACAEACSLEAYGIGRNSCIDGELMKRIFAGDRELAYYLHTLRLPERDMFGQIPPAPAKGRNLKDPGQRKACGCMVSKDIGTYNTCPHLCAYCYANTDRRRVLENAAMHDSEGESIIG